MDWQRERDGLVVVGAVVLLLLAVALGSVRGFVVTFVATFLGVFAALRVNEGFGGDRAGIGSGAGAAIADRSVGGRDAAGGTGDAGPNAGGGSPGAASAGTVPFDAANGERETEGVGDGEDDVVGTDSANDDR